MNNKDLNNLTEKYLRDTDDNIIGVSYGYNMVGGKVTNELAISFSVRKKLPEGELDSTKIIPKEIKYLNHTFITDVIEEDIKMLCDSAFYLWETVPPSTRNLRRPLKGGVSVTNFTSKFESIGTLGFLALDASDGSIVGVSNNHVLVDDSFIATERTNGSPITNVMNNIVTQPHESGNYGSKIGTIKRYVPISLGGVNYVDGAITTIDAGTISYLSALSDESWRQEGLNLINPPQFATTAEIDELLTTDPLLYSAGRTTGAKGEGVTKLKTFGVAVAISVSGYVKQDQTQIVSFSDCIKFVASAATNPNTICLYPIYAGDSGSALIADFNGTKKIIGLCFAGSDYYAYACRIDRLANELNIRAWGNSAPNYSNVSNTLQYVAQGLDSRKNLVYNGNTYWQVGLID